jgi:hypothetical protein
MHVQTVIDQLRTMRLTTMAESLLNRISTNDAEGLEPAESSLPCLLMMNTAHGNAGRWSV